MATHVTFTPLDGFDVRAKDELRTVGPLDVYMGEERTGYAALFGCVEDGERVGSLLFRIDETPEHKNEFVVVAAVGEGREPLLLKGWALIEGLATGNGADTIRFHTESKGLARHFEKQGAWVELNGSEHIVTVEVNRG